MFASQVFAQCDVLGGLLELQFTTNYDALLRGDGQCLKPTTVTGGLVLTGGELKIIEGDTIGQVLTWDGGGWIPQTIIRDTFFNGLNRSGRNVKLGGTLVQNTTIDGVKTYDFVLSNMRRINFEAERTSGAAYAAMQLGSTDIEGFDLYHISTSSPTNFGYLRVNNTTGNILRLQSATNVQTEVNQYWDGASHVTDIGSTDGVDGKTLRITKTGMFAFSLDKVDEFSSPGIMMYDTFTNEIRYQSPDILLTGGNKPDSTFVRTDGQYWGKQTHSAVYRTGKTGFGTADTTGIVNVAAGEGSTRPNINIPDNSAYIFRVAPDSHGDSIAPFTITRGFFDNASEVGDNQVVLMGFNTDPGGGKTDATKAGMSIRWDEKYDLTSDGIKRPMYELHVPQVNFKTGTGNIRPLSGVFGHEQSMGGFWGMNADYLLINDYKTASSKVVWGFGDSGYPKGITFVDTAQLRFGINNYNIFSQRKADGVTFTNVIKVDNSDQVLLGGGTESRVAAYNHLRVTNTGLISNENNEILIGNTSNPTRLIVESNDGIGFSLKRTGHSYMATHGLFNQQYYIINAATGTTPWRLNMDAPEYSFWLRSDGKLGLGEASPMGRVHITASTGTSTTKMLTLQNLAGTANFFRSNVDPEGSVSGSPTDVCLTEVSGVGVSLDLKLTGTGNTVWGKMLTNVASTSGTANDIPKYGGANTLQNSIIQESGNNILLPWGGQVRFQFSGSYNVGMRRGSGRNLELFATSPDSDGEVALVPSGGTALTAKHDGKIGIGTTSPAQKLHVEGTARITGSDGTATTITGRDADGDISNVSLSGMAISSGTLALSNSGVTAGTYGEEGAPFEIDVAADGRITSAAAIAYTSATYTSGTTTWQALDKVVFADPTSGNVIIEMNGAMHEFVPYILAGGSNLTNSIKIRVTGGGEVFKISGEYGTTTSDYTLTAGQHLTITRVGTTYIVNKN